MHKNELLLRNAELSAKKFGEIIALLNRFVSVGGVVFGIYVFFEGLAKIAAIQDAEGLNAAAALVDKFGIGTTLGYMLAGGFGVAWRRERNSKKRAIREKSRYQKLVESSDAYRSSSGLDENGDDPEN